MDYKLAFKVAVRPALNPTPFVREIISGGGLAQLGERLNGIQEVRGSTPLSSTISRQWLAIRPWQIGTFFRT